MTVSGGILLQNELILAHNTSTTDNLSVVISNLPYNENITALLSAHNCIGFGVAGNITFNVGKFGNSTVSSIMCAHH